MKDPRIETYTGRKFDPMNMQPEDVCIEDIAHHLSMICRFTGATKFHYSVGQHSLLVCDILNHEAIFKYANKKRRLLTQLEGLLHDGAEAYFNDIARPVKQNFKGYKEAEEKALGVIIKTLGAQGGEWEYVQIADDYSIFHEAKTLMHSKGDWWDHAGWPSEDLPWIPPIVEVNPEVIESRFLNLYFRIKEELP